MGNKPSTTAGTQVPKAGQDGSAIIREGRPGRGQQRPPRPTSEPFGSPSGPQVNPTPDPNFSLRVRDSGLISGRGYGMDKKVYSSNPTLPTTDSGDGGYYDFSYLPRGIPEQVRPEDVQVYMATVNQVTTIWPEYEAIKTIEYERLPQHVRTTLQMILKRLSEQHESIKELSENQHRNRQQIVELVDKRDSNRHLLHRKDNEIRGLKEDVQLLRSELHRLGQDIRLPAKTTIQEDLDTSYSEIGLTRPGSADGRQRGFSNSSISPEDDVLRKLKQRERDGIFKATPMLQAEGSKDELKRLVTRNHSLRPIAGEQHPNVTRRTDSFRSSGEDTQAYIQRLEAALDRETKRNNEILKDRQPSFSNSPRNSISTLQNKRVIPMSEYRERYHQVEAMALGKIKKTVLHQLSHVNKTRQQQFMCVVMQRAYDVSFTTVRQLKDIFKSLILNPVNINVVAAMGERGVHRHGSLASQIKVLESFKPGQGINNNISKLAKKTLAGEEIPEALINQINDFLEGMSDVTNIIDLVQNVIDSLRRDFSDCTTPSLLNQSDFSQFLHDCCRISWQMCIPDKQLYVCSNDKWRYEERYHVTDDNKATTNARIDFYVWPILFSRVSGGEVLYKGRVVLKL